MHVGVYVDVWFGCFFEALAYLNCALICLYLFEHILSFCVSNNAKLLVIVVVVCIRNEIETIKERL